MPTKSFSGIVNTSIDSERARRGQVCKIDNWICTDVWIWTNTRGLKIGDEHKASDSGARRRRNAQDRCFDLVLFRIWI